jgi:5-methylthioadenosine/S-adenosylhomocysteine deaminase
VGGLADRLLIEAGWVVTMDPKLGTIRDGAVLIEGDSVTNVGPAAGIDRTDATVASFPSHVLLPGLVNGHTHVAGCVFRGLLEDRPDHFYGFALPMERELDAAAIRTFSLLGIAELLLSGCTVMNDMFHHSNETAGAAVEMGIRSQIAHKVFDAELGLIGQGVREYDLASGERRLEENVALYEEWHGKDEGRVEIRFGLHAADTCSPELMAMIRSAAEARGAGIHTHVAQSRLEDEYVRSTYGCSSVAHLDRQGLLSPSTIAVHLLFADQADVATLGRTGARVAHCPACVTKVAARLGPLREMYDAGIEVGWGTDWVSMDPWDAMRFGIVATRLVYEDELALGAQEALSRFTMGSATILGWEDNVGSLTAGKKADLILVEADQPHLAPLQDPVGVLVYNASGRDVSHVMVGGEFLVEERRLTRVDAGELVAEAQTLAESIWGRSAPKLALATASFGGRAT